MARSVDRTQPRRRRAYRGAALVVALGCAFSAGRPAPPARADAQGIDGEGQTTLAIVDAQGPASGESASLTLRRHGALVDEPSAPFDIPAGGWRHAVLRAPDAAGRGVFSGRLDAGSAVARARHAWPATGGSAIDAPGDGMNALIDGAATADVWVPLAVAAYHGATSVITIQSGQFGPPSEQVSGTFHVSALALGRAVPDVEADYTLAGGGATTIDLGSDPAFVTLRPNADGGFLGALRITSADMFAVHAMIDVDQAAGVADFTGIPASSASTELFVPFVHSTLEGDPSLGPEATRIAVVNTRRAAAEVHVSYVGVSGTCAGRSFAHDPTTLAGGSMALFDQGDAAGLATGPSGLPDGCVARAIIAANQPVVATLFERQSRGGRTLAAATDALTLADAALPGDALVVPWFADDGDGNALSSDLFIMNVDSQTASVRVDLARPDGARVDCGDPCRRLVVPWGVWRLRSDAIPAALRATAGGAVVTADATILAFVRSAPAAGGDAALWPASVLQDRRLMDPSWWATLLPLVLRAETADETPSPAPTPTASPTPSPPPFVPGRGAMGGANSTLLLANIGVNPATLAFDLYASAGARVGATRSEANREAMVPRAYPLVDLGDVPPGAFAAVVAGGGRVGAAASTAWGGGGRVLAEPAPEGFDLIVPFAPIDRAGETSTLFLHNPETFVVHATVELRNGAGAALAQRAVDVAPRSSLPVDWPAASPPDGPAGFGGSVRVTSDRLLAAQVRVEARSSAFGVFDVAGQRTTDAQATLYAPRVERTVAVPGAVLGARRSTRLIVVSAGAAPAIVRPTYEGVAGPCAGFRLTGAPFTLAPRASRTIDLAGDPTLPDGCTAAAALSSVGGALLGVAIDGVASPAGAWTASAQRLAGPAGAGTRWLAPRFADGLPGAGGARTALSVLNAADSPANVTFTPQDGDGRSIACGAPCAALVAPRSAVRLDGERLGAAVAGRTAAVVVTADQPVVVAVLEAAPSGAGDEAAMLALRSEPQPDIPPARLLVPDLAKAAPTPTPSPRPSAAPSAAPSASPTTGRTPSPTANAATPTRAPLATATPGGGSVTLYAVAVVNVSGNTDPTCPACDGRYDDADRAAAARSPLPELTFVVRAPDGGKIGLQKSVRIDRMQIAAFTLPAADDGGYDLSLDTVPEGWQGCPNAPLSRHVRAEDFVLGAAKVDFHFSDTCLPANRPPLEPVQIPGGGIQTPVPTDVTTGRRILLPAILRSATVRASSGPSRRPPSERFVGALVGPMAPDRRP